MNETYVEVLVKRKDTFGGKLLRTFMIVLTIMSVLLGLFLGQSILLLAALIFGFLAYLARIRTSLEYEYLYIDKEISIDKIYAQTKRKRAEKMELERIEIIAPIKSYRLDNYKNRTIKAIDYSSGVLEQPDKRYVIYYDGVKKYIIEPTPAMIKAIQQVAPRKVFTD